MAPRTSPPFRADHVGSLLRPQRLLQARDDFAAGQITAADLTAVEDEVIPSAIQMQEEVGLQSATDGEFRRASWHMDFIYALGGVSKAPGHLAVKFHNANGDIEFTPASIRIDEKLGIRDTIFADAFVFLRDICDLSSLSLATGTRARAPPVRYQGSFHPERSGLAPTRAVDNAPARDARLVPARPGRHRQEPHRAASGSARGARRSSR